MATGVITQNWQMGAGPGDLPRWTVTGWATYDSNTIRTLEKDAVRCKFTKIPNRLALVALSLDGLIINTQAIHPPGYGRIPYCIRLKPVTFQEIAGEQPSGPYAGYAIIKYRLQFQQLEYNHI